MSRVIVVLDANRDLDQNNWRASEVAASESGLSLQHDGTCTIVPRHGSDQLIRRARATNVVSGATDPAGIYSVR